MNRFVDALSISEGACNPIAITGVIHKHMLEMLDKGMTTIRQDPAIRLMVHQLAYLCSVDGDFSDYLETLKACESKAKEETHDVPDSGKAPS